MFSKHNLKLNLDGTTELVHWKFFELQGVRDAYLCKIEHSSSEFIHLKRK